jgi:hypothetical protein
LDTGVTLMIFNRPETTARVFDVVAGVRPKRLFVIADGPRAEVAEDAEKCAATRAIVDRVDWDCEVLKNYSDVNLGVGIRPGRRTRSRASIRDEFPAHTPRVHGPRYGGRLADPGTEWVAT